MKVSKIYRFEEHHVELTEDVDYSHLDLIPDPLSGNKLYHLGAAKLTQIAKEKGFDGWSWQGLYENGQISVRFQKSLDGTFFDLLQSLEELDCDLIIGGCDMPASFVWGRDDIITDYGKEKYKQLMDSKYTRLGNGNFEIHCDNDRMGEEFCMAAAGYIGVTEYEKIFSNVGTD